MAKFKKISLSQKLASGDNKIKVSIFKYQKIGTKRFFFAPETNGKRISSTLFSTRDQARSLARAYMKFKQASKPKK